MKTSWEVDDIRQKTRTSLYSEKGKQIKKGLIDKDLSAKQLAVMVGTTPQYLNKIIHGVRRGDKYMGEICRILEIKT